MRHNKMRRVLFYLTLCLALAPAAAGNVDPDGDGSRYAWTENAGWINAAGGGNAANGLEVSDFALTGWMWAENAGWISLSCENTNSCGTASYGVTNNGHGRLRGLAWGESVGWINFAPSSGGVGIDPGTGEFSGFAWGENIGRISFSCTNTGNCALSDYGVRTGWCQSTVAPPTGGSDLRASRSGGDVTLSQLTLGGGASWHEVVRGDLTSLRASGGDFASATFDCAADDVTGGTVLVSGTPEPAPGGGYWYLARPANCKGKGTFDSGAVSQSGSRDDEINASGAVCP